MAQHSARSISSGNGSKRVRYAVVGIGWIAQEAVLPAFQNATNSELVALVTRDPNKAQEVGRKYGLKKIVDYDEYGDLLASDAVDAVYIALPNHQHREFTVRAARAGIHVLCEKPMAETELDCMEMIDAAREGGVKLMIAYRLHFEEANLHAVETVKSGKIGEPRFFSSVFSQSVADGNVRLKRDLGGGPLMDMGVYCINAARYLFREEPLEVSAFKVQGTDKRFEEVPEMVSAVLRFPGNRLATFTCSFGAAATDSYRVVGTKGDLRLVPGYDYHEPLHCYLTVAGKTEKKVFEKRDQFGAELLYFSNCILNNEEPQPSGQEGLADVRIIRALVTSMESGIAVDVKTGAPSERPSREREIDLPPVAPPEPVDATSPTGKS